MIANEYLREPNAIDITWFLEINVARGFFLGYLDASIACIGNERTVHFGW
jgi:hypothetical protein